MKKKPVAPSPLSAAIRTIQQATAEAFEVDPARMPYTASRYMQPSIQRKLVLARQVALFLAHDLLRVDRKDIVRQFGGKDPQVVSEGRRLVTERARGDTALTAKLMKLRVALEPLAMENPIGPTHLMRRKHKPKPAQKRPYYASSEAAAAYKLGVTKLEEVRRETADTFKTDIKDMLSKSREQPLALNRQIAMFLCYELTGLSLPDIGKNFGGRDHTTVLHACQRVSEVLTKDKELDGEVRRLRRRLVHNLEAISQPAELQPDKPALFGNSTSASSILTHS